MRMECFYALERKAPLMLKLKLAAFGLLAIAITLTTTGCNQQPKHPNQMNDFDGATYDSLTVAHAALLSLRTQISTNYKQHAAQFNEAATSYSTAFSVYSQYRAAADSQSTTAGTINALLVSVVTLEVSIQKELNPPAPVVQQAHRKAAAMRAKAAAHNVSISDVLTELEIAATIAETVPATSSYANLASMVIEATTKAVAAYSAAVGQPIDLASIQPVPAI
jgi:hypothetical protein